MRAFAHRTTGLALLAAGALTLAACAPADDSSSDSGTGDGDDVTLTVWSWRTEDVDKYDAIFDVYEEAHPGVTIDFQAFKNTEYAQILTTGLTGSDGPDVVMVQAYGRVQPFIEGGNLVAIDDLVDGLDGIDPAALDAATGRQDGKLYGVPFASQIVTMYYNKALFEENGIEEPTTWDEFIEANDTLESAGITPMAVGGKDAWTLPMLHDNLAASVYGGNDFRTALLDGSTTFDDPAYVASLETVKSLQQYMPEDVVGVSYSDAQSLFLSGQAGMFPGGSYELSFFQSQNPDLDLGVFTVPAGPDAASSTGLTPSYQDGSFAINAASEQQDADVELLNWIATPEFGQLFADNVKQPSPISGVTYDDPLLAEMSEDYADHGTNYLLLTDFRWGDPSGTDVMSNGLQELFLGSTDAATLANDVQTGVSAWFVPGES